MMNDPFARLPVGPNFALTSTDVTDGQELPVAQMSAAFGVPGGLDRSSQLTPTPAFLGFSINAGGHLLGRAVIIPGRRYRPPDPR